MDVRPDDEVDPRVFFGDTSETRKRNWKAQQLCKQVERAAAVTLADRASDEIIGASVLSVEPAPDARRLLVVVCLGPGKAAEHIPEARAELARATPAFRDEVARSIHRKRVPEIVFDVRLAQEVRVE
jgi:ribosome-binding factor A